MALNISNTTALDAAPTIVDHIQRNQQERLLFTSFIAILAHALVILGIQFSWDKPVQNPPTLDVTLASFASEQAPQEADFLAQENQLGSGTELTAKLQTTNREAVFQAPEIKSSQLYSALGQTLPYSRDKVIAVEQSPQIQRNSPDPSLSDNQELIGPNQPTLLQTDELATLEAKLDELKQQWAKRPRITRITAAATLSSANASYIHHWRREIETMGRLNYPVEAQNCQQDCRLRLLVAIHPDGSLAEITVLQSSGRRVLDDAAVKIVKMAAPFAPFTAAMRQQTDLLEIIRTWTFTGSRYVSDTQ